MILLRHGQTVFNQHFSTTRVDPGVPDPSLTEHGRLQAAKAADSLARLPIRRIVASPYSRAIETALIVAERIGHPVEIDVDVRERAGFSCDIGAAPEVLSGRWPDLDFSALAPRWWAHPGDPAKDGLDEPEAALNDRVYRFRTRVAARDDWDATLVVCHWGPIRALIGRRVENGDFVRHDPHGALPVFPATP
ncbi:MAG: histidine phosphatase family protein [Alphaproteobacteria bacterium]